jgi:hypothetical protein
MCKKLVTTKITNFFPFSIESSNVFLEVFVHPTTVFFTIIEG